MTVNGLDGMAGAHELRAMIREVLRDALATGYLAMPSPAGQAVRPGPATGDSDAHVVAGLQARVLTATPPSSVRDGIRHQIEPARGLAAADAAPASVSASGPGAGRGRPASSAASTADGPPGGTGTARYVRLATDEDLREFVLTVLRLADNPARRRDLLAGRLRVTLTGSSARQAGSPGSSDDARTCR